MINRRYFAMGVASGLVAALSVLVSVKEFNRHNREASSNERSGPFVGPPNSSTLNPTPPKSRPAPAPEHEALIGRSGTQDTPPRLSLGTLAKLCRETKADQTGVFVIDSPIIFSGESASIDVPCKLEIRSGGSLGFDEIELRTHDLLITADEEAEGASFVMKDSRLRGYTESGFLLEFRSDPASVAISGSTLDYPLAVWIRLNGELKMTDDVVRSTDSVADGIVAGTTETAFFERLDLRAPREPYLSAKTCRSLQVTGTRPRCQTYLEGSGP